ncbi:WD repeat-containing protein 48 homolog [Spodoptera frugiperda]|uniref:WD repeat-containing protein 48 homolog n=1 Tax=Spodoptera frugiperda TaxID=7108 RepID=A0A9R0DFG9_SPOFR|nr:WD repeat-containing protein 48 homolog [Spodoptera frugiperda]
MVLTVHTGLQFLIAICTINGLNSHPTRNINNDRPLGVLSELMGNNGKKPLIVVIDTNRSPRDIEEVFQQASAAREDHNDDNRHNKKNRHNSKRNLDNDSNNNVNSLNGLSKDAYEVVMYDILKASRLLLDKHQQQETNRMYTAEQCSDSKDKSSCGGSDSNQC